MPVIDVLGSTMYYEETGEGVPVVFLHGNPGSSHMWRRVLPAMGGRGRLLAPDLIGMGRSGKPDVPYRFGDHARHLDAWFDTLGLDDVVLVGHDWGGALAFDWAARHPGRVRGVAFFETIVKPMTWDELGEAPRARTEKMRGPEGEKLVLGTDFFVRTAFTGGVLTPLADDEIRAYLEPYPTPESRHPILQWARSMPIEGEPADVVARVERYDAWLAASDDVPKLLITFDSSPTLAIGPALAGWCAEHIANLEIEHGGPSGHHAPEDRPDVIAASLTAWADRRALLAPRTAPASR
ncbi:haloalkane dehalogenase [Actinomadura verrucosospora]|uniref:Putative haloalkane dehalogenase, alpha/beta hydrolase family n=1 Tax=Actinomadura verrucosospora TaxID=46165 RepID=A0A7D3ZYW8_ACTVE|nr:haloalkane dehalogenase [Actinomadura verrucosospora]QKG23586.1 putative haloalkane dehalogenase, alpha/beta hydrolase family [Actinomadura verrucosospora]